MIMFMMMMMMIIKDDFESGGEDGSESEAGDDEDPLQQQQEAWLREQVQSTILHETFVYRIQFSREDIKKALAVSVFKDRWVRAVKKNEKVSSNVRMNI